MINQLKINELINETCSKFSKLYQNHTPISLSPNPFSINISSVCQTEVLWKRSRVTWMSFFKSWLVILHKNIYSPLLYGQGHGPMIVYLMLSQKCHLFCFFLSYILFSFCMHIDILSFFHLIQMPLSKYVRVVWIEKILYQSYIFKI